MNLSFSSEENINSQQKISDLNLLLHSHHPDMHRGCEADLTRPTVEK